MIYSKLLGVGSALPPRCVSNEALVESLAERGVESSSDWIEERTGIKQRYLAEPDISSSQLGFQAAQRALEHASRSANDVDLIIVATSTPDVIFPSTACLIQQQLGCKGGAAFDVQAVCAGFVYGLATADAMIRTGMARCALVIGAEVFSRILDWNDRRTCVLFGDGAGAVVLGAGDSPGIHACALHADGSLVSILQTAGQVCSGKICGHPFLTMDGQAVFKTAVNVLDQVAREVCAKASISVDELDWLIPHQANIRILQATAKRLALPLEKVIITVDQHANTSAASVPLALDWAIRQGKVKPGQKVLLEGVGGGMTWGACLLSY
ncbi:MAG: ketoacyl-ACP synthase III [Betaproteobacteria bacterium]|jgi:3-oxoacyl-[acyl-carrier-protein] synthase-3|nr:ketoacyl-ACP synthase III [Pseudomonadota bacterium]NBO04139.1 ketoacyl-ACP synthase III [Betaproteobacteria bacterium]HAB47819.1 3-oxoacyl-ACP synthase [Lautropia sp.]NBP36087.1 ketoacyl-ACP synthase III [Betaproteobacteria bacterium]NBQ95010.1 ketoacyl-ACP synthase III [Betaproteobacteria bacterium]